MGTASQSAHKKKVMIEALEKSLGIVTTACKLTGVSRRTYYDWLKNDKKFAEAVEEMDEIALDFAESHLHQNIKEGKETSTIFYLKTKGKRRGYIERTEIANINTPAFVVKPGQKGVMKVLKTIDERNKKAGT
jgi:hypothetical protein